MWWCQGDKYTCHNNIFRLLCLFFSQHPKLTNKSVFHDIYVCPVGAQVVVLWEHGPSVITLGLLGLKQLPGFKFRVLKLRNQ